MKLRYIITIILAVVLIGCAAKYGMAHGYLGSAKSNITNALPHTDKEGKIMLGKAVKNIDDADKQLGKNDKAYAELNGKYVAMENSFWVKVGKFISRTFWVIAGLFGVSLVLRIVSMGVTGPAGTTMAVASTGILGVLSGGVSWVQALFDNIHFRRQIKKQAATTPAGE